MNKTINKKAINKAIFFDRDGIVNKKPKENYVRTIEEFEFNDYFIELFSLIKELGFLAILVTNQQCVGKGIITENRLLEIHNYMQNLLYEKTHSKFDCLKYCPDLASSGSVFRKPEAGMFLQASQEYNIAPEKSWTVGDYITDVEAGKKAGTKTILVGDFENVPTADYIFPELKSVFDFFQNNFSK